MRTSDDRRNGMASANTTRKLYNVLAQKLVIFVATHQSPFFPSVFLVVPAADACEALDAIEQQEHAAR